MKKTISQKINNPVCALAKKPVGFTVLPGDNISVRLVVKDSSFRTVHVCESVTQSSGFGKIGFIDLGVTYPFFVISKSVSHYPRENEKGSKVDK